MLFIQLRERVLRLLASVILASPGIVLLGHAECMAFPLNPARIYARDKSHNTGQFEVEVSVWQGGAESKIDDGKQIYLERRAIETDAEGYFDFWLGEGTVVEGTLFGVEFGLDRPLRLQLRYRPQGSADFTNTRLVLQPIDNAYIAIRPRDKRMRTLESDAPAKTYEPKFSEFSPELVRRGVATLYPDSRLQTEDGSFLETTSTTTSGVQELFDYCTQHHVDGYIVGGSLPRLQQIVYRIHSPLRMHPAQGIRIDTGAITLQFMPEVGSEPGLTIDSCMMNDIRIRGLLHYLGDGYALAVKPSNPLPLDRFVGNTIVDTFVYVTSIACDQAEGAVCFDGSINYSRFEFNEINHGRVGINVLESSSFSNNRITCKHIHGQTGTSILDKKGTANVWEVNLNCDAKDPLGIVTNGSDSIWLAGVTSRSKPGLTLLPEARGNQFFLMGLNGGYDNQAEQPTNRFYASPGINADALHLGFAAETPSIPPSGEFVMNRNPFPVIVMIKSPGSVSRWEVNDTYGSSESIDGPLKAGQEVYLSPGEGLRVHYGDIPPDWRWRAIQ